MFAKLIGVLVVLLDYKVLTNAHIYFFVIIIGNIHQPPLPKSLTKILVVNHACQMQFIIVVLRCELVNNMRFVNQHFHIAIK